MGYISALSYYLLLITRQYISWHQSQADGEQYAPYAYGIQATEDRQFKFGSQIERSEHYCVHNR